MSLGKLVEQESGQSFPLGFDVVTIGRHEDNTIILPDLQVSRHHAEIAIHGGRWAVRDLDSANGTYVNSQRITEPHVLRHGDMIRVGQTQFQVEIPSAVARQDTLVEGLPVPVVAGTRPLVARRRAAPWVAGGLVVALLVLGAVAALLLWLRFGGNGQATATLTPGNTAVVAGAPTASPASEATPLARSTTTSIPTIAPPSPQPTLPPAAQISPGQTDTPGPKPVIGTFRASPETIETGQCARLEWGQVENANRITLSDVGRVGTSGKIDVCLDSTKTYTLEAAGAGGTVQESLKVTVRPPTGSIIEYLRVVPSIIAPGDCAQLEWGKVENAQSAVIEPDIGGVATPGNVEVCPGSTTTYALTASSPEGTNTARVTLIVSSDSAQKPVVPFFSAKPGNIEAGECISLTWGKVDYATEVTIDNGIGGVATPGSQEICPGKTTTYRLTAIGPGGTTESEVKVNVSPAQLADLPDLVIESILFEPNPCYRATKCKVRIKVRNDGTVDAGHFVLHWAPEGAEVVPVEWDLPGLVPGQERELSYTWIPARAQESWTTVAIVDVFGDVDEIEEGEGNSRTQVITVLAP